MKAKKFTLDDLRSEDIFTFRDSLSKLDGVKAVRVDTVSNTVTVDFDDDIVSASELQSEIERLSGNLK